MVSAGLAAYAFARRQAEAGTTALRSVRMPLPMRLLRQSRLIRRHLSFLSSSHPNLVPSRVAGILSALMRKLTFVALSLVALAAPAFAGETYTARASKQAVAPPEREPLVDLDVFGARFFEADFDRRNAAISMTRVGLFATFKIPLGRPFAFEIGLITDYTDYEVRRFSSLLPPLATINFVNNNPYTTFGRPQVNPSAFANRSPISDVYFLRLEPLLTFDFNRSFGSVVGPTFEFGGANNSNFGDTIRYGGIFAGKYVMADKTAITLGVEVQSRLERSFGIYPFIRIKPGNTPGGMFSFIPKAIDVEARPNGARVIYNVTPQFGVFVAGSYDNREYRLSRRGSVPNGVWRESGIPVSGGVRYNFNKNVSVNAFGGVILAREVEIDDRHGNHVVGRRDVDPSPFAGGDIRVTF